MMYKSIERLNGDPTPLKKLVDDYVSGVSAYLALRQAALMLRHPDDLSKEKSACTDQLNQIKSHLVAVQGELDVIQEKHKGVTQKVDELEKALRLAYEEDQQLRVDIETKSALMDTMREQVTEKDQALANLEAVPTLSPEKIEKLKEHERDVLELQLSLNPDNWMSIV